MLGNLLGAGRRSVDRRAGQGPRRPLVARRGRRHYRRRRLHRAACRGDAAPAYRPRQRPPWPRTPPMSGPATRPEDSSGSESSRATPQSSSATARHVRAPGALGSTRDVTSGAAPRPGEAPKRSARVIGQKEAPRLAMRGGARRHPQPPWPDSHEKHLRAPRLPGAHLERCALSLTLARRARACRPGGTSLRPPLWRRKQNGRRDHSDGGGRACCTSFFGCGLGALKEVPAELIVSGLAAEPQP